MNHVVLCHITASTPHHIRLKASLLPLFTESHCSFFICALSFPFLLFSSLLNFFSLCCLPLFFRSVFFFFKIFSLFSFPIPCAILYASHTPCRGETCSGRRHGAGTRRGCAFVTTSGSSVQEVNYGPRNLVPRTGSTEKR